MTPKRIQGRLLWNITVWGNRKSGNDVQRHGYAEQLRDNGGRNEHPDACDSEPAEHRVMEARARGIAEERS